jgi:beta-1,4-N-acetylglucosaminyltransferase
MLFLRFTVWGFLVMAQPFLFVTVGSTDFDALIHKADELVPRMDNKAGIMQIGSGRYMPVNMPYFRFAPSLATYYEQATLVVAHGGLAVTMEVLAHGLPLVSVSNADRYDQHQEELLRAMAEEGYLCWCQSLDQLEEAIEDAQSKTMRRYTPPASNIHQVIEYYLSSLSK